MKLKEKILGYQLEALESCGVKNSIIILGFEKQQVVDYIKKYYSSLKVDFVFNDKFQTTDNAFSLALGLEKIDPISKEVLILERILSLTLGFWKN